MRNLACVLLVAAASLAACGHSPGSRCAGARDAHMSLVRVDDSSEYMQRVYEHVGMAADGAATDPAAIAAGIRIDIDMWRTPHDASVTDYRLVGPHRATLETYVAGLGPALQVPADHRIVYEHVAPRADGKDPRDYWRSFYVDAAPILDQTALATAEVVAHDSQPPTVQLGFTRAGGQAFEAATAKAVGHKVAFVVDGEVDVAPVINTPIRGGKAEVTTPTKLDAELLMKRLGCTT